MSLLKQYNTEPDIPVSKPSAPVIPRRKPKKRPCSSPESNGPRPKSKWETNLKDRSGHTLKSQECHFDTSIAMEIAKTAKSIHHLLTEARRVCRDPRRYNSPTVAVLTTWLKSNIKNPYPTISEKKELMRKTGLDRGQVTVRVHFSSQHTN